MIQTFNSTVDFIKFAFIIVVLITGPQLTTCKDPVALAHFPLTYSESIF
jgi:hypothetical protein